MSKVDAVKFYKFRDELTKKRSKLEFKDIEELSNLIIDDFKLLIFSCVKKGLSVRNRVRIIFQEIENLINCVKDNEIPNRGQSRLTRFIERGKI